MAPLDYSVLPTTRKKSVYRILHFLLIDKVLHIQSLSKRVEEFEVLFGSYARSLIDESQGRDTSLVKPPKRREHLLNNLDEVYDILISGSKKASKVANANIAKVRKAMGLIY